LLEFQKRLIKGAEREFFLFVDRDPAHRGKKPALSCQRWGKLRVFFLPPDASDRNPDALVGKQLEAAAAWPSPAMINETV
jgi:hypothetical protein